MRVSLDVVKKRKVSCLCWESKCDPLVVQPLVQSVLTAIPSLSLECKLINIFHSEKCFYQTLLKT